MQDNIANIGTAPATYVLETDCFRLEFKDTMFAGNSFNLAKHSYMPINVIDGVVDKLVPHIVKLALEIQITMFGEEAVADGVAPLAFACFDHTSGKMLPEHGEHLTPRQKAECEKKFVEAFMLYTCLGQAKEAKEEVFPSGRALRFALDTSRVPYRNIENVAEAIGYRRETSPLLNKTIAAVKKAREARANIGALPSVGAAIVGL